MTVRKRWLLLILAAVLAAVTVASAKIARYMLAEPVDLLLASSKKELRLVEDVPSPLQTSFPGRNVRYLTLASPKLGQIRITLSLPDPTPAARLPVVVLLGGLRTGCENISYVKAPGRNVLVGFEYPIPRKVERSWSLPFKLSELRRQVLSVPGQVVALLEWLHAQPWADPVRGSVIGVSLGALYLPSIQHLAQTHGIGLKHLIIAYGGVDIGAMVANRLTYGPAWARRAIGAFVAASLRPVEPALHLPKLKGEFLLIGASGLDKYIPACSIERLYDLTPEPKTVLMLKGGHFRGRKTEIAARVVEVAGIWLSECGAVNS